MKYSARAICEIKSANENEALAISTRSPRESRDLPLYAHLSPAVILSFSGVLRLYRLGKVAAVPRRLHCEGGATMFGRHSSIHVHLQSAVVSF